MIDRTKVEKLVNDYIRGTDIFLVAVKVSRDNKITVSIDTETGVTLEQCVELNRFIEQNLDREEEDYELEVSSPGIGYPFVVKEQYLKNKGKLIEVLSKTGEKFRGVLKNVTDTGFEIECSSKKKSKSGVNNICFNFDGIKSAKEVLIFK